MTIKDKDDHTLQLDMFLFMENRHITHLVKAKDVSNAEKIRQMNEYVITQNLHEERYQAILIHAEICKAIVDLNDYRARLMDEIVNDIQKHKTFYTQFVGNIDHLGIAEILNILSRQETIKQLKKHEEGILFPREEMQSSARVNCALKKYRYVTVIRDTLSSRTLSPQERINKSTHLIELAMPVFSISRDTFGIHLLKGLLAICTLFIAAPFIFDTKGRNVAAAQLSRLSLLAPIRQARVMVDEEEESLDDSLSMAPSK